jgi:hypothetical protein
MTQFFFLSASARNAPVDAVEMLVTIQRTKTPKLMQYCITPMSPTLHFSVILAIHRVQYSRILELEIDVAQVFKTLREVFARLLALT